MLSLNSLLVIKLVLFLAVFIFGKAESDVFTSLEHMGKLAETGVEVTKYLKTIIDFQREKLAHAERFVEEFEFLTNIAENDPQKFIGNPMNAFLLIKLLYKDYKKFFEIMDSSKILKDMMAEMDKSLILPNQEDFIGAAVALHRLEDTYLLEPADMRGTNLSENFPLARRLTSSECFEIGLVAYSRKDYYHSVRWISEALTYLDEKNPISEEEEVRFLDYLAYSTAQQGNIYQAYQLTKRMLEIDPNHERAKMNEEYYKGELNEMKLKMANGSAQNLFTFKNERPENKYKYDDQKYQALCRGESTKISESRLSKLKCRYLNQDPLIRIAPVKEEQVYDDPPIWIFHDVITDKQIEEMKTLASFKLRRAIVRNPSTGNYETADYRISKSGWLHDRTSPSLSYLSKFLTAVTNLSMETAEEWQIANYGLGGQYDPHFDFARTNEKTGAFDERIGNRIATWLFYAPEKGGATVFTPIGFHVHPIRRAAVFWYNLLPSGNGDYRTRHAACPVLFGSKWVSNKWIHERAQEFRRPCNLVKEEVKEEL